MKTTIQITGRSLATAVGRRQGCGKRCSPLRASAATVVGLSLPTAGAVVCDADK